MEVHSNWNSKTLSPKGKKLINRTIKHLKFFHGKINIMRKIHRKIESWKEKSSKYGKGQISLIDKELSQIKKKKPKTPKLNKKKLGKEMNEKFTEKYKWHMKITKLF